MPFFKCNTSEDAEIKLSSLNQYSSDSSYNLLEKNESKYLPDVIEPTGFHNMPANVLVKIFSFFEPNDIRNFITPVCRKWREIGYLPQLWRHITYKGRDVPTNFICQEIRIFTELEKITLENISNLPIILRQIVRYNTHLKIIEMKNCNERKVPDIVLRNLVAKCRNLEKINLKGTPFSSNFFFIEVAVLPKLKSINLSSNRYLTTKNMFELVLNNPKLEELKICGRPNIYSLSDNDAIILFTSLRNTIKYIAFDMVGLNDIAFKSLFKCEKLEKVSLYNTTNIQAPTFNSIWKKLPNLKSLKMYHLQINSKDFVQIFTRGSVIFQNLYTLDVTGSWKLNAEGLGAICENCPNLKKLTLKCCKNLDDISSVVKYCKKLEVLNLAFCNKIPNSEIMNLAQLPNIKVLYSDKTRYLLLFDLEKIIMKLKIIICTSEYNKKNKIL